MERLKLKQVQQLRLQKELRAVEQKAALRSLVKSEERIEIALKFAEETLRRGTPEGLSQYSPAQISRLVFDREIELLRGEFQRLPGGEARVEHFLVMMLRVMRFPFEKTPMYLVGLKEMFYEVAGQGGTMEFASLFRYLLGEVVSIKEEQQNTEFQVQLQQRKKQDYLLHDNGIKRIRYSRDAQLLLSLDHRASALKVYDHDMKLVARFSPNKLKHSNKFPLILDFDYSEISTRLGLLLSDHTLTTVNILALIKSPTEFEQIASNQVVFALPQAMSRIFFMQMMNKWLVVAESGRTLYLLDMERARSQPQKVVTKVGVAVGQQPVSLALEVVPLSCVSVVSGNEVSFLNESVTTHKFTKFVHVEDIIQFKYSDQRNQFYLCGKQRQLTIFNMGRSGQPTRIRTLPVGRTIVDFDVFPQLETIVVADEQHQVRLLHEPTRSIYQQAAYAHIVKAKDRSISIARINKHQFVLYQTYQLVLSQEKIAIERGIQYTFLPYHYFDPRAHDLYLSLNGQIISFSILTGQVRRHFNPDSSNLHPRHTAFFIAPRTPLFVLDHEGCLYQVYPREQVGEGESRTYRKKVGVEDVITCFYDEPLQILIIVGKTSITQVRNDRNNNFNILNTLILQGIAPIVKATFCPVSKALILLTSDQLLYHVRSYEPTLESCLRMKFPKDAEHQQGVILQLHFDSSYGVLVLLSNRNEIYFIQLATGQQLYFNIEEHLPTKLKDHRFTSLRYQVVEEGPRKEHHLLLTDDSGILIQFPLTPLYEQHHIFSKPSPSLRPTFKETIVASAQNIPITQILLNQSKELQRSYADVGLMKAHEKAIALALRVRVEIPATLTVSIDGIVKLWNQQYELLFSLKLPSLMRLVWNMTPIEEIKNRRATQELLSLFNQHFHDAMQDPSSPIHVINKSKRLKQRPLEHPQPNPSDPFRIDIDNKDLEELVMQQTNYSQLSPEDKARTHLSLRSTHLSPHKPIPHPWRTKKQFRKIYEKASPTHKYKHRIPQDLLQMRSSLDMAEKQQRPPSYREAELILPQLAHYDPEPPAPQPPPPPEPQTEANFQSCLYVKSLRRKKKINELDEIDKEFKKKEMVLTARKWIPKKRRERTSSVAELKPEPASHDARTDPIRSIQSIFEQHNRECLQTKKGRLIHIPKINLSKDFY